MTPLKAIRAKCLDCCCGQANEVKLCTVVKCPLYEFRHGKNPHLKGKRGKGDPNIGERMKERKNASETAVQSVEAKGE